MSDLPAQIGRYKVLRLLGEGGMGVLYLATDPVLDRHVALKLLRVDSTELRRRFVQEAQSAARIQHPNIVTVYDVGDHDGQLYIAMEYIDGDTLAALIRDAVPFSAIRKLDIIDEIAEGLGFAHQRGIIHRDIKPANLMMTRSGLVKVLDFGIARVAHKQTGEIDRPTLIGTPAYMAPEQLEGVEADARSDIYAVGLVMYELFSGRRAFAGATTADVLELVLAARPTPIDQLVPDIDPDLARIIVRAMARQPAERYQDLQAMRKDLSRARRRAMLATADDATVVVGMPIVSPAAARVPAAAPPTPPPTVTDVPAPPPVVVASTPPASHRPVVHQDETVFAPVADAAAPESARAGAKPAAAVTATPPVLPPLPTTRPGPGVSGASPAVPAAPAIVDEGPMPVPLPAVPAGVAPAQAQRSAGRATVDAAPALEKARASSPPRSTSPPRTPDSVAPAPLASAPTPPAPMPLASMPGGRTTAPLPTARKGLPAAVLVGGLAALLAVSFVAAFLVVRALGLFSGPSLMARVQGIFATPAEPKGSETPPPAVAERPAETPAPSGDPVAPATPVTTESASTEVAVAPAGARETGPPALAPPATEPVTPAPITNEVRPLPAPETVAKSGRVPPARDVRTEARPKQAPLPVRPAPASVSPREAVREAPREIAAVDSPAPPRPEPARREPEPPAAIAPREEAIALVRGYVAARNTSHASGIRRVWPDVDDVHVRRVTSSFSAPLTLGSCDVDATDATHAVATCHLTQPGTTGAYASGQALTIRRTLVFDLARQGRNWVIVGLRE